MNWLVNLFERHHLFRRAVLLIELYMLIYVTNLSYFYIIHATNKGVPGVDVVMVVGALQAPFIALLGYSFKIYSKQRSQENDNQK